MLGFVFGCMRGANIAGFGSVCIRAVQTAAQGADTYKFEDSHLVCVGVCAVRACLCLVERMCFGWGVR